MCFLLWKVNETVGCLPEVKLPDSLPEVKLPNKQVNFISIIYLGFPGGSVVKNLPAKAGDRLEPWVGKTP